MYSRRVIPRLTTAINTTTPSTSASLARPFASSAAQWDKDKSKHKAPAISDIEPDQGHIFDQKQKAFRDNLAEANRKRKEQERASESIASAKSSPNTFASTHQVLGEAVGSLQPSTGEAAREQDADGVKKKTGRLSSLIYGTEEGREMDREIERSFSQVLARGKYVHSIVFHEVKPDKVDEYVELVGQWYPKMASMPENKVHLVGSWRTEVGECDTFGELTQLFCRYPPLTRRSPHLGIPTVLRLPRLAPRHPEPQGLPCLRREAQDFDHV